MALCQSSLRVSEAEGYDGVLASPDEVVINAREDLVSDLYLHHAALKRLGQTSPFLDDPNLDRVFQLVLGTTPGQQ